MLHDKADWPGSVRFQTPSPLLISIVELTKSSEEKVRNVAEPGIVAVIARKHF